jgi:dTDP-4-dehydrorhamnose 3,5-epimerase
MNVKFLDSAGIAIINLDTFIDSRGLVLKTFKKSILFDFGINFNPVEEVINVNHFATIRGLHFQFKKPQSKLINVIKGKIFDVVLDLRVESPTFGKIFTFYISSEDRQLLYVPERYAHGFLVLEEGTIVSYLTDSNYDPEYESGIYFNDAELAISWPKLNEDYIVSEKDFGLQSFEDIKKIILERGFE